MKNTILLFLFIFPIGIVSLYSQSTVGRQLVDQYPVTSSGQLTYGLTWLPTDYNSTSEKYPLLIFLHGSGECGDGVPGLSKLISTALPMKIAQGWNAEAVNPADKKTYKFIVVSPQAPAASHYSYTYTHVRYILADLLKRYRIDESRIYISGLSAGGAGTWSSVTNDGNFTQRIAAIVPVSAMGVNVPAVEQPNVQWIGGRYGVKVWAVCGELDGHFSHNQADVNTINSADPPPQVPAVLTLIPGAGHDGNAWNTAYDAGWRDNPFKLNVFEWMLQYYRGTVNPPANMTPVAKAGNDITTVLPANSVNLDGGGSSDPDGTIASYKWVKTAGPATFNISDANASATSVTGLVAGVYSFELTVTDDKGATAKDVVTVTVNPGNQSPVAKAGNDIIITLPANSVNLDGGGSSDPDGTIASYKWVKTAGPATFNISDANAAATSVTGLVAGVYSFELTVTDDKGATAKDVVTVTVNPGNQSPVAKAGNDIIITLPANSVNLDGGGSSDPDGTIASYKWVKTAGPATFNISDANAAATSVTGLVAGVYSFELTVTDDKGATAKDVVTVTVNPGNQSPVAKAGNDIIITLPANSVNLDGAGSSDPDGTIASYKWVKTAGPATFNIIDANAAATSVTGLVAGVYSFELTVTDDKGATAKDVVTVTVNAANQPPTARAGNDITITLPANTVNLDGGGSSDPDGTIANYKWAQTAGPSTFTIGSSTTAATSVTNLVAGIYSFELTVTDDKGATAKDVVTVTVNPGNQSPVAKAGNDVIITLPANSVNLDGSASTDPDGTIASYKWVKTVGPATFNISDAATATTSVTGLVAGVYSFELTVTDDKGANAKDVVNVTVSLANPPANQSPTAKAGNDLTITLPVNSVSLDGGASADPDGTIATYKWIKTAGPASYNITNLSAAATTITSLVAGTYTFELTVTDDKGATAKDEIIVTVNAANQPPIAKAGNDITIALPTNSVSLDGAASTDPDGTIASYKWVKTAGPASFNITSSTTAATTVTGLVAGTYTFELTVTDDKGATAKDEIIVTVNAANQPPIAKGGSNLMITLPTNSVNLDGSASSDPDGTIAGYKWAKLTGPSSFNITSSTTATTSVTGLVAGDYSFELTVTDDKGATAKAIVYVIVNEPPVAKAGDDIVKTTTDNSFPVDGSASYDPDGTIVSYSWVKISGPSPFTMTNPTTVHPTLVGLLPGVYELELTVTDNRGATAKDRIKITIEGGGPADNKAPVANAGNDQTIMASHTKLDGTGSTDAEGMIQSYLWEQVAGPSQASIATPHAAETAISGLTEGTYEFELTVADEKEAKGKDRVVIVVAKDSSNANDYISVYPVPVKTTMSVKIATAKTGHASISVYSTTGLLAYQKEFMKTSAVQIEKVDISALRSGTYIVVVQIEDDSKMTKMIWKQ